MQYQDRIAAIEYRAKRINLRLAQLCKLAGVGNSSFSRWRHGTIPLVSKFETAMGKLEHTLAEQEASMLRELKPEGGATQMATAA